MCRNTQTQKIALWLRVLLVSVDTIFLTSLASPGPWLLDISMYIEVREEEDVRGEVDDASPNHSLVKVTVRDNIVHTHREDNHKLHLWVRQIEAWMKCIEDSHTRSITQ